MIKLISESDIKYNSYYIAGLTSDKLFLANTTAPSYLLSASYNLADTQHIKLSLPDGKIAWPAVRTTIDSPFIYMIEGISPTILRGNLSTEQMVYSKGTGERFDGAIPISSSSVIARVYDRELRQSVLIKLSNDLSGVRTPAKYILEKQSDGLFCTDGMLNFEPKTARLLYLYYYRNEFISLDTNLNVLYKGRTIDTTRIAKLNVVELPSGATKLAAPMVLVNKRFTVNKDWIFIYSGLRASNEEEEYHRRFFAIDVYDVKDGKYQFSFYLPEYRKKRLREFKVFDKKLVAIYDHDILTFQLNF